MKAFALIDFESGPDFRDVPVPEPGAGDLLVRVHASSINRIDVLIAAGVLRGMMEYEFPVIPGRDFAGVVERVGPDVTRFRPGDEVLGWINSAVLHDGTWAELVVAPESGSVAPRPAVLDAVRAAALPLAGLTALGAVDAVAPQAGDRVLVVGASGGVGSFAVQLAAQRGATVIATAKPGEEAWLTGLGADETVDYTRGDLVTAVGERYPDGIDCLVDAVDQQPADFERVAGLLRDGGRAASTLGAAGTGGRELVTTNVRANDADPVGLARLAELAGSGELEVAVTAVYPFEETAAAIAAFSSGKRGKIALTFA